MSPEIRSKKRSLREVLPKKDAADKKLTSSDKRLPRQSTKKRQRNKGRFRLGYLVLIIVLVLVLVFVVSSWWVRATVIVTPKQADLILSGDFVAVNGADPGSGEVTYEVVTLPATEASQTLNASGEEELSEKASGEAIISNNYSKSDQRLVVNTRLEASDGRIYRLTKATTVPGQKVVDDEEQPGEVRVAIVADSPGESFNSADDLQFTIPGFKDGPRYSKFSARSVGGPSGGFVGTVKVVSESDKEVARQTLEGELRTRLLEAARAQIPADFVLFDKGTTFSFEDKTDWVSDSGGETVNMVIVGQLRGAIFELLDLSRVVVGDQLPSLQGLEVSIRNLDKLDFDIDDVASIDLEAGSSFTFSLAGEAKVMAQVGEAALKQQLAGEKKIVIEEVLGRFPGIEKLEVVFRPPWAHRFPATAVDIVVSLDDSN
ncbi:MAG: hypothetical protein U9M92_00725 [Patescibacteria group bacterium]|nr:hypothetical protein [Patescibacteria group bacterium]